MSWRDAILKNFNLKIMTQNPGGNINQDALIHEIVPGLFLAGYREAIDGDLMTKKGVTHIVSLTECPTKLYSNRESLIIPCKDVMTQNMLDFVPTVNDYIHNHRNRNGRILVHCMCGVSRGPTMVIAYLMSTTNLTSQEAYNAVVSLRNFICPNPGFRRQLVDYENSGALQQERLRIKSKFMVIDYTRNDEIICRERMIKCMKDPTCPFYRKFPDFYFERALYSTQAPTPTNLAYDPISQAAANNQLIRCNNIGIRQPDPTRTYPESFNNAQMGRGPIDAKSNFGSAIDSESRERMKDLMLHQQNKDTNAPNSSSKGK